MRPPRSRAWVGRLSTSPSPRYAAFTTAEACDLGRVPWNIELAEVEHVECSQTSSTRDMSCSTSRIPIPRSATTCRRIAPKRSVSARSSPEEGSSSSSSSNGPARHRASSTSRRCPVDSDVAGGRGGPEMPHSSIAWSSRLGSPGSPGSPTACIRGFHPAITPSAPASTFSRTVSDSNSSILWNVRPSPWRARADGPLLETSRPPIATRGPCGFTRPEQALRWSSSRRRSARSALSSDHPARGSDTPSTATTPPNRTRRDRSHPSVPGRCRQRSGRPRPLPSRCEWQRRDLHPPEGVVDELLPRHVEAPAVVGRGGRVQHRDGPEDQLQPGRARSRRTRTRGSRNSAAAASTASHGAPPSTMMITVKYVSDRRRR